jgi:hypothetical protein
MRMNLLAKRADIGNERLAFRPLVEDVRAHDQGE